MDPPLPPARRSAEMGELLPVETVQKDWPAYKGKRLINFSRLQNDGGCFLYYPNHQFEHQDCGLCMGPTRLIPAITSQTGSKQPHSKFNFMTLTPQIVKTMLNCYTHPRKKYPSEGGKK